MRVALLFIDGVGVGPRDARNNPLARAQWLLSQFDDGSGTALPHGGTKHVVDTTFGVEGRPQSASNQAALYTGQPAPRLVGRHVLGFPNAALRELIARHSIARRAREAGRTVAFANAFPAEYLQVLGLPHRPAARRHLALPERYKRRARASASLLAMAAGGATLRTFDDAHAGEGLTHDIDGSLGARRRVDLPRRTPAEAAEIFWSLAADLTLFEHSLADEAGHLQDHALAAEALGTFDAFARAVVAGRPEDAQVLIVSDHGNVEDLSTRSHTRHPVATLSFGPGRFAPLASVADVGRAALEVLGVGRDRSGG